MCRTSCFVYAEAGACACLFAARFSLCGTGSGTTGRSSFTCIKNVLKRTASVVAKDSALIVTVLTCFSSASVLFKSVLDGAVESRLGFCRTLAFFARGQPSPLLDVRALIGVLDVACSVSVFCECPWEMTVVCCTCSCIMCTAFVTRSSETCSGICAGEAVAEESSHPFQASFHPCFHRVVPCHWA